MLGEISHLRILSAYFGELTRPAIVGTAKANVLLLRVSGKCVYDTKDGRITVSPGECVFFPEGYNATARPAHDEPAKYAVLYFKGEVERREPLVLRARDMSAVKRVFEDLSRTARIETTENKLLSISHFYRILYLLAPFTADRYMDSSKLRLIEPAISYLEYHIFDSDLEVGSLHVKCDISHAYFCRIFSEHFGMSPVKYVTEMRLERARRLIEDGACRFLYEVAEAVGYNDPLYFSKLFKKRFSASPKALAQGNLE